MFSFTLQDSTEDQIVRLAASSVLGTIVQHVADPDLIGRLLSHIQSASSFIPSTFVKPHSDAGIRYTVRNRKLCEWNVIVPITSCADWFMLYKYCRGEKNPYWWVRYEEVGSLYKME